MNEEVDARLPISTLLERYPHLRAPLAANGLESCCGGMHPLEVACAMKGVPLAKVLEDLRRAHQAVDAPSLVPPTMSVREVRRQFPATRLVFERYGLGDCGGEDGPDEPVAWFATMHRLRLDEFLRDIRAAALEGVAGRPPAPAARPAGFSPHFIIGSLALTLTLGATTGMVNLLRIAAGGDVPISHRQIHAHTQILGFATLFLMGIAYHALPRILGIGGSRAASARPAFWLMFSGVVLRNAGQPLGFYPIGGLLSLVSAGMEVFAGLLFVGFVSHLLGRLREGKYDLRDPVIRFVRAGTIYLLVALGLLAGQGIWLAAHVETAVPIALTESFYFAALYGFLLAWIYGFANRVVSVFLGVGPAIRGTPGATLLLQAVGVGLGVLGFLPSLPLPAALVLRDLGLTLVAASAVVFLVGHGFLWRSGRFPNLEAPGSPGFAIRAAFACLALWSLLELAAVGISRTTSLPAQNLWWTDAARHVFTVGFLTLLIVGMSFRILPVFSGKSLWSPRMARWTYALILIGTGMRLLQYPAAFAPVFYRVGSFMGIAVVLALLLFTFNLVRTMRARPPATPLAPPSFRATLPAR